MHARSACHRFQRSPDSLYYCHTSLPRATLLRTASRFTSCERGRRVLVERQIEILVDIAQLLTAAAVARAQIEDRLHSVAKNIAARREAGARRQQAGQHRIDDTRLDLRHLGLKKG